MKQLMYQLPIFLILTINLCISENNILYWANDGNDYEIFKYDMLTESTIQLTDNTFDDAYPVVSPNGDYIYFSTTESGVGNIWRMDMDGGNRTQITDIQNWSTNIDHLIRLDISDDNLKIVFSYKIAANGGYFALYTMDIDGSNVIEISPAVSDYTFPHWSPDGTRILCGNNIPYNGYSQQILEMNADGSGVTTLIPNSTNYPLYPRYSPDGTKITYTRNDLDLYTSDLDGTNEINLTNSAGIGEAYSIWGIDQWIYYRKNYEIHRVSTDGLVSELVASNSNYNISAFEPYYDVSDESLIAYYPINGNSYDESGNGNGGNQNGGVDFAVQDRFSNGNSAATFDGIDDYIDTELIFQTEPNEGFSFAVWFKSNDGSGIIMGSGSGSQNTNKTSRIISIQSDGYIYFGVRDKNSETNVAHVLTNEPFNDGLWHNIVGIYDGAEQIISLFVDGELIGASAFTGTFEENYNILLGAVDDSGGAGNSPGTIVDFYNGILDDVRIYSRALDLLEVIELYHLGDWNTDYTLAHWDFNQGSGNELMDIS